MSWEGCGSVMMPCPSFPMSMAGPFFPPGQCISGWLGPAACWKVFLRAGVEKGMQDASL